MSKQRAGCATRDCNSPLQGAEVHFRKRLRVRAAASWAFVVRLTAFAAGLNAGSVGSDAAYGPLMCGRASLALAMPRHFGSVSDRSAVPGVVVLRTTPDDVLQFVKQYRNLRLRSVPVVTEDRQHEVTTGPRECSPWVQLHDTRSTIEERSVGIQ